MIRWMSIFFLVFINCKQVYDVYNREIDYLKNIVYLRTEGLIALQQLKKFPDYIDVKLIEHIIDNLYVNTQNQLVELCTDKELYLHESDYDQILSQVEIREMAKDSEKYHLLLSLLNENLLNQKELYIHLLKEPGLKEMKSFAYESYLRLIALEVEFDAI